MTCLLTLPPPPPPALTHFPLSGAHTSRLSGLCTGLVSCFYLCITAKNGRQERKREREREREREEREARIERDCSTLLQCSSIYSICSLLNGSPPSRTHTFSAGWMLVNTAPASILDPWWVEVCLQTWRPPTMMACPWFTCLPGRCFSPPEWAPESLFASNCMCVCVCVCVCVSSFPSPLRSLLPLPQNGRDRPNGPFLSRGDGSVRWSRERWYQSVIHFHADIIKLFQDN